MSTDIRIVKATPGGEIDPKIDQKYQDQFGGQPRSLKVQKQFDARMQDAADEAVGLRFDALKDTRADFARAICDYFGGRITTATAELLYQQRQEAYDDVLLDTMFSASAHSENKLRNLEGISRGEAGKQAAAIVYGQEATQRIRTINEVFPDVFYEVNNQQPFLARVKAAGIFVAKYVRPTHKLLADFEGASDIPHAEALYGNTAMAVFGYEFDRTVDSARMENAEPDPSAFTAVAFNLSNHLNYDNEFAATKEAFEEFFGKPSDQ